MIGRRRTAFTFLEILVALCVLASAGICLMTLMNAGSQVGARATETRMAVQLGARVMDHLVAAGYRKLSRHADKHGPEGDLDLATLDLGARPGRWTQANPAPAQPAEAGELVADGFRYRGRYRFEEAGTGLLKVRATLTWRRYGLIATDEGSLALLRYVADPVIAFNARPFGR